MTDYRPIDCNVHDLLESFSVLRKRCRIDFETADGTRRSVTGRITDIFTRDGAEYLRTDDGTEIRLDRLRTVEPT